MSKRVIFLGGVILVLLVGIAFWFSASEQSLRRGAETGSQMCEKDVGPISFKRLSDEKSFPFLNAGRSLSFWEDKTPYYDDYREAVARFSDVRSCLVDSER